MNINCRCALFALPLCFGVGAAEPADEYVDLLIDMPIEELMALPIEAVTNRFNAACYGAQPADLDEINQLRAAIEEAAKKPKPGEDE